MRELLVDRRLSLFGWALGVSSVVALQVALYPTVRSQPAVSRIWDDMPVALKSMFGIRGIVDMTSGAGYLRAEVFGFTLPLLLIVFAIGQGAAGVAGDEERGLLSFLLAQPVRRERVVVERFLAMVVMGAVLGCAIALTLIITAHAVGLPVAVGRVLLAVAAVVILAIFHGGLALLGGCVFGRRSAAIATAAGLGIGAFLVNSMAAVADVMARVRWLSPFAWADSGEYLFGRAGGGLGVAIAASGALVLVSAWILPRRDIRSG